VSSVELLLTVSIRKMALAWCICRKPNQMVTLYAGDSNEKFKVHKEFACHYSPVLKAAFNSNFIEGQTKTYRLQETTERAARLLVHWFYTQKLDIFVPKTKEEQKSREYIQVESKQDRSLVELWVLAGSLFIPSLQNMVTKEILRLNGVGRGISTYCINYVYEKTPPDSPLRLLYVGMCAGQLGPHCYRKSPDRYPQEMLIDLVTVLAEHTKKSRPRVDSSRYDVAED
jgi:hypothetical protein